MLRGLSATALRFRFTCTAGFCAAALAACTTVQEEQGREESALSFAEPQWLSVNSGRETTILAGDLNEDGWYDVLMWDPGEQVRVALAIPSVGLSIPKPVSGLPAVQTRQAQLLELPVAQGVNLTLIDDAQQLRQFSSLSPTELEEVGVLVPQSDSVLAFAWGDLDGDGWLDAVIANDSLAPAATDEDAGADSSPSDGGAELSQRGPALVVWLGQSDGSFRHGADLYVDQADSTLSQNNALLHLADVDSDGDLDIAAALPELGIGVIYNQLWSRGRAATGEDAGRAAQRDGGADAGMAVQDAAVQDAAVQDAAVQDAAVPGQRSLRFEPLDALEWMAGTSGFQLIDYDGDGDPDWFHFAAGHAPTLLVNDGTGRFSSAQSLDLEASTRGCLEDFDNDGSLDVLAAGSSGFGLIRVGPPSKAAYVPGGAPNGLTDITSLLCLDIDKDGDVDVMASGGEGVALFTNRLDPILGGEANFFGFRLEGREGNARAVGTRIQLRTGSGTQTRVFSGANQPGMLASPALHFGLGLESTVEQVRLTWPDGEVQETEEPWTANDVVVVSQPEPEQD